MIFKLIMISIYSNSSLKYIHECQNKFNFGQSLNEEIQSNGKKLMKALPLKFN